MPADILLPLFVLTLVANAFLVATAIRDMRRGQAERNRPIETGRPSRVPTPVATVPPQDQRPLVPRPAVPAQPTDPEPPGERVETATDDVGEDDVTAAPIPAPRRRRTTKKSAPPADPGGSRPTGSRPTGSRSAEARRGRRRFALPPLDDDHERVSRSIETFLGGIETTDAEMPPDAGEESPGGPATVAIVAVDELPDGAASGEAVTDALAMVERTLRGAARGTDVVTTGGRGRFRIVLPSTGEVAARAYVRRIRATIEPRLVDADRPLRLVVATATVLDEPLEDAVRRAEHRLSAALGDAGPSANDTATDRDSGTVDDATVPRAATD